MVQRKWLHGFLELCLLSMLAERRDYGRGLSERLVVAGFDEIPGGTLYPALIRLEKQGLVEAEREVSAAGPPRRYFRLTDRGTHVLAEQQLAWRRFRKSVDSTVFPRRAGKAAAGGAMDTRAVSARRSRLACDRPSGRGDAAS